MIYLIDDKTSRQQDFGWNEDSLISFNDVMTTISRYDQIEKFEVRKSIFSENNIILFHESFFESIDNKQSRDINEIRNNLLKNTIEKQNFKVIFFSGSYNSRELNKTGGSIPVSILYQNLSYFLENFRETNTIDLSFLFFGKNAEIENILIEKREIANSLLIEELQNGKINYSNKSLLITGNGQGFSIPFISSFNQTIFNKNILDEDLDVKIHDWLSKNEYDNVFIPLCFGPTLSDYNGLRLATHTRCTTTKNQLKPIFIYSFVDYNFLIGNEYFDILKSKNVFLIEYSKKDFQKALDINISQLKIEELSTEIKKINLDIPNNYEDSHSIANEWAIHRWSKTINANDTAGKIDKINIIQSSNLYFKYLKIVYPISDLKKMDSNLLKANFDGQPKVIYIDDEAEKGWKEIFYKIFLDVNDDIDFIHLDDEFNEKSKEEIIDISVEKIIEENIDLVILDFRLHKDDFENSRIDEVTGYQILQKVKEHNKGIQIIIFSATNKIWNLLALQEAGADGFIVKESPENSIDPDFTNQSILNMIQSVENCLSLTFLKEIYSNVEKIKKHLNYISNFTGDGGLEGGLMKMKFKNEIFIQLDIIFDCLKRSSKDISTEIKDGSSYLNLSFTSIYKIIELINDYFTDERGRKLKSNSMFIQRYNQNSDDFSKISEGYSTARDKIYSIIKFELKDEPLNYCNKFNKFHKDRNNITHPATLRDYKKTTVEENIMFLSLVTDLLLKIK